ncbi:hypothetical protein GGR56DRAFT_665405 [Xylariaceae sp. FL0804]|nr:hypothetical protein GGR56DRAFT_665405 [Xylariaceae sp. FL0804]
MNSGLTTDHWSSPSPVSDSSSSIPIPTPPSSSRSSSASESEPAPDPSGPLLVTSRSVTSWRTPYPTIGHFAVAKDEIFAASPHGLFSIARVRDHASQPWTEPRRFGAITATTMEGYSSISGLAIHFDGIDGGIFHLYSVSLGVLRAFQYWKRANPRVVAYYTPLQEYRVSGTPAVAAITKRIVTSSYDENWFLMVPCHTGGLLYINCSRSGPFNARVGQVAENLVISAVSAAIVYDQRVPWGGKANSMVAVCIVGGRLYAIEGPVFTPWCDEKWNPQPSTRIQHPGQVTGNPVLINSQFSQISDFGQAASQLDLLVPSAEGGIFHFVRTPSSPDEWHMIGRIIFPAGVPPAVCLAFHDVRDHSDRRRFRAFFQSGGRLYQVDTAEGATPWSGSRLKPIVGPGPFYD